MSKIELRDPLDDIQDETEPSITSKSNEKFDLDELLNEVSDTKVVLTTPGVSATNLSDTNLSATNKPHTEVNLSATNLSVTKGQYMNRYKKENKDTLRIDFPKGTKHVLKREADKRGISVTRMIKDSLREYLGEGEVIL